MDNPDMDTDMHRDPDPYRDTPKTCPGVVLTDVIGCDRLKLRPSCIYTSHQK